MQMLKNIFSSDKKYYLELDEVQKSEAVQNVVETTSKVTNTVKETATAVVESQPVQEAVKTATEVAETAQEQLGSVTTAEKPAKTKSAKAEKNGKAAKSAAAKPTKVTPKNSGASSFDPPFWVAAMYNSNGSATGSNGATSESETFATNNLMPTVTKYRRRPGDSLNKFKDMAKNVRTSRR